MDNTQVYKDKTQTVVIEADGQKIEVNEDSARCVLLRLCSLFNYGLKPRGNLKGGFLGVANANHTKDGKVK